MSLFESLGLNLPTFLFHLLTVAVLVTALYFLLAKPIRGMIATQKTKLNDIYDENQRLKKESDEAKAKYDSLAVELKQEVATLSAELTVKAQQKADEIIEKSQEQAKNIISAAKKESRAEKQRLAHEHKESVAKIAVEIAEKVLEREIKATDNQKIIDDCLSEWKH